MRDDDITLAGDLLFLTTKDSFFAFGSMWMLGAALLTATFAAAAGLIEFLSFKHIRRINEAWHHMLGNVGAVTLSLLNFGMRYKDGPLNFILPGGLMLSLMVCTGVLISGWLGQTLVYRYGVGVTDLTKSRFQNINPKNSFENKEE